MISFYSTDELGIKSPIQIKKSTADEPTPFSPIGIGKPLIIRLHTVYLGDLRTSIFTNKQDVMVTSAIKDDITFDAAVKSVNQIFDKAKNYELLVPKALNEGTELVYYTKALDQNKLLVDFEIKADKFKQEIVDGISGALAGAAGVPLFVAYSPYLLVGSQLLKIGGKILNNIIENSDSILSWSYPITQNIGGSTDTVEGFKIGFDTKNSSQFIGYEIQEVPGTENQFQLVKDGEGYKGDAPYIIISVDGAKVQRYENFKSTLASASLLKRFYGKSDSKLVDEIKEIMEIYNDFTYIGKISKLEKEIKKTTDPEKKKELEKLLNAYKENVVNEEVFKTGK